MKYSRFLQHYFFHDVKDENMEYIDKLREIIKERFPNDEFPSSSITYGEASLPKLNEPLPAVAFGTLFIGIGQGALVAAIARNHANKSGTLFAVNPPPGIGDYLTTPYAAIYGSESQTYMLAHKYPDPLEAQIYGIPNFIHGPTLSLFATAYLLTNFLEKQNIYEAVTVVAGEKPNILLPAVKDNVV